MFSTRLQLLVFLLVCACCHTIQAQCSASISSTNTVACTGTDVSIPVTLSGEAPFVVTYQINGVAVQPVTATSTNFSIFIPNVVQTITVQLSGVVDGTGCQASGTGAVIIEVVAPPIYANASYTFPSCSTNNDGALEVFVTGGIAPYSYAWSSGQNTSIASGLSEGNYTVTVTDANGCSRAFTYLLQHLIPIFQWDVTPSGCNMTNGVIDVQLASPTASTQWSTGANTEDLTNVPAGIYTLVVTEATTGCTREQAITIPESKPYITSTSIMQANCSGQGAGLVGVVVAGGTPPYAYLWSNGATTPEITNLFAGVYYLTITDAAGCVNDIYWANVTATGNTFLNASVQQPTCNQADGSINLNVSGGTMPYQFLWSNGATTEDLTGIGTGTYTVTVTEGGGCTQTLSKTLAPFSVSPSSMLVNCLNNINLTLTGGTAPYTYLWSNDETTQQLTGVAGGTYAVTVTDALGCEVVISATVSSPPVHSASIVLLTNPCSGGLSAQMSGIQPNNTIFLWSTGSTTRIISNIPPGEYTVTTTASSGCTATATITTMQELTNSLLVINTTATPVTCNGLNNGSIVASVTGFAPPFTYHWSNGATTPMIANLAAGNYTVTVTDANGCTLVKTQNMPQPAALIASWQVAQVNCNGTANVVLVTSGGTAPYAYIWSNGFTTSGLNGIASGSYILTITDANGCVFLTSEIIVLAPLLTASIQTLSTQCSSATLAGTANGSPGPFTFNWIGPGGFISSSQNITVSISGVYTLIVTNANGCTAMVSAQVDLVGNGSCGYISGKVARDESDNCLVDAGEPGLAGWLVRAESASDTFYGVSNLQGDYWIGVPTGNYTVVTLAPNALWEICLPSPAVTVNIPGDTLTGIDLPVKVQYQCPSLSVSLGSGLLRRCMSGTYYVNYCNEGTTDAIDPFILVTLDPFLTPGASTHLYTDLGGGVLQFNIGDLAVGQCGYFSFNVQLSCAAVLGQTHCTEAHIYPDGNCVPSNDSWSGASLRVTSQCNADSVHFTIKNIGVGDMIGTSNYIVVEDAVMLMSAPFQLAADDSTDIAVPANGSTWRVEVQQEPFHPGLSAPALSVEACSAMGSFSTGFVTQFPNNEQDPWIDIDCKQNVGSWDPNDKQGFPIGYGTAHYIRPGTELEYMIRFQNTGTDTAFTVRIADTLSSWLDVATIRPGAGSHPYKFNLTGSGFAEFLFENIMLPDSNVNQEASNGFVKFSIYPRADAPLETLIENTANIYFDSNDAVVTNTTRHRLGENFLTVGLWQPRRPAYQVLVSPNPFSETALLEVKGIASSAPLHLQVFDLQGKMVMEMTAPGPALTLKKGELPNGTFLFKIDQKGLLVGSGKLMVRE